MSGGARAPDARARASARTNCRATRMLCEHAGLIDGLRDGDAEAAEAEARNHVTAARRSYRADMVGPN